MVYNHQYEKSKRPIPDEYQQQQREVRQAALDAQNRLIIEAQIRRREERRAERARQELERSSQGMNGEKYFIIWLF